jgi:acyl dehydratase
MTQGARTYFEDIGLDEVRQTPGLTVTAAHVGLYAGVSGDAPEPGGRVPDLLPVCLSTGLSWRVGRPPLAVLAFLGFELQILRPLQVGDTVHGVSRAASRRAMREGGLIIEDHEIIDQRGEVVQRGRFTYLVARRPAPGA